MVYGHEYIEYRVMFTCHSMNVISAMIVDIDDATLSHGNGIIDTSFKPQIDEFCLENIVELARKAFDGAEVKALFDMDRLGRCPASLWDGSPWEGGADELELKNRSVRYNFTSANFRLLLKSYEPKYQI